MCLRSAQGGAGKTTTAINVAHGLAQRGHRVLLVDLDPLGWAATSLEAEPAPGVAGLLLHGEPLNVLVVKVREGLDLLPGDSATKEVERVLLQRGVDLARATQTLRQAVHGYDYAIVDTPSGGLMQDLALRAADLVLIAATPDYMGTQGMMGFLGLMADMGLAEQRALLLPALYDGRVRRDREGVLEIQAVAAQRGLGVGPVIPKREEMREAAALGRTVWEHTPRRGHEKALQELCDAYALLINMVEAWDGKA
jgi:chromosome partitioning protein